MAKAATQKPSVALVHHAPAPLMPISHGIAGTIAEKIQAFDQIAANIAGLQLNGWDTVQKAKAGCWLADGKSEHPAVFMENHYVMVIKNKLTVEPKWEYMVRKLKETVPGFRYKIEVETNDRCVAVFTDGVDEHRVEYTTEDAQRQGLMSRDNAWTSGSTREMCLKQVMKRGCRRLGVGRAAPWVDVEVPFNEDESPSEAVVIEEQPAGAVDVSGGAAPPSAAASPPAPQTVLSDMLTEMYGKLTKEVRLQKASFIYNEMQAETTGARPNPPVIFKRADAIGPAEAQEMIDWLNARAQAIRENEIQPEPEPEPEPEEPPAAEGAGRTIDDDYSDLEKLVKRARKVFAGRSFLTEAPAKSGKFWFVDQATFSQMGKTGSFKVAVADDNEFIITIPQMELQQLNAILKADCDAAERGR